MYVRGSSRISNEWTKKRNSKKKKYIFPMGCWLVGLGRSVGIDKNLYLQVDRFIQLGTYLGRLLF